MKREKRRRALPVHANAINWRTFDQIHSTRDIQHMFLRRRTNPVCVLRRKASAARLTGEIIVDAVAPSRRRASEPWRIRGPDLMRQSIFLIMHLRGIISHGRRANGCLFRALISCDRPEGKREKKAWLLPLLPVHLMNGRAFHEHCGATDEQVSRAACEHLASAPAGSSLITLLDSIKSLERHLFFFVGARDDEENTHAPRSRECLYPVTRATRSNRCLACHHRRNTLINGLVRTCAM